VEVTEKFIKVILFSKSPVSIHRTSWSELGATSIGLFMGGEEKKKQTPRLGPFSDENFTHNAKQLLVTFAPASILCPMFKFKSIGITPKTESNVTESVNL
jgi:hypothetical protein